MSSLVTSLAANVKTLPAKFVVPVDKRPGKLAPIYKEIPVIDLADADQAAVVEKILKAGQEFGLFQVIDHGVEEKLMMDAISVGKEFFSVATEEKENLIADETHNGWHLYTSSGKLATKISSTGGIL